MAANVKDSDILTDLGIKQYFDNGREFWEIPHGVKTREGAHGYFRYIGKFPPQIARAIIEQYSEESDTVLDPMCGGGTTLTESILAGRRKAIGYDVNPVALTIARAATSTSCQQELRDIGRSLIESIPDSDSEPSLFPAQDLRKIKIVNLGDNAKYFTDLARLQLSAVFREIEKITDENKRAFFSTIFFSILRRVSLCNVKKMNIEFDHDKKKIWPVGELFRKTVEANLDLHNSFSEDAIARKCKVELRQLDATQFDPKDKKIGLVVAHPPYMSNTAFSESTQLQLAFLGIDHKTIWKKELRHRGSYLHEPNGVQKYLVNWCKIIREAYSCLKKGGHFAAVVGDGQVDTVRIPVGIITREFCEDTGFTIVKHAEHVLNNNTGRTLNRRMRTQHIVIARKS
jgi:DNA modification methylase